MLKRINVILPESTIQSIDRLARPGERSRFIDRAVQHYVRSATAEALQQRLKAASIRDRDLDREIARDWFAVDQDEWQKLDMTTERPAKPGRRGVKSGSSRSTRR